MDAETRHATEHALASIISDCVTLRRVFVDTGLEHTHIFRDE